MKLARLAVVHLRRPLSAPNPLKLVDDEITAQVEPLSDADATKLLIIASLSIPSPPAINISDGILIPEASRKSLEAFIERFANLASISTGGGRAILSPKPEFAFFELTSHEREQILAEGVKVSESTSSTAPTYFELDYLAFDKMNDSIVDDHYDGIAILADAFTTEHPVARFGQLCRFFERAFGREPSALVKLMSRFMLHYKSLDFRAGEFHDWFVRLRALSVHADRSERYAIAADVSPALPRMEFAAYDVLFNKTLWRSYESDRREMWIPQSGMLRDGTAVLTRAGRAELKVQMLDCFGVYPLADTRLTLDPEWLSEHPHSERTATGRQIKLVRSLVEQDDE